MKPIAMATVVATMSLAIAGCEPSAVELAKNGVAERLRDPDSAKFRNVVSGKAANGLHTVCGEVNGKNVYGAYAGYERFIANNEGAVVYLESQYPIDFRVMWITDCP